MSKKPTMRGVSKTAVEKMKRTERRAAKDLMENKAWTQDSFQNFALRLGVGTDNALSGSSYGFNPITRNRTLLEWIHRGSWLGGVAIDLIADDMTKAGVDLQGDIDPKDIERLRQKAMGLGIWSSFNDGIKWGRLYGGAIAMYMIEGQDPATPLKIDRIAKGQFRGLLVLDRWQVNPSLENGGLVTEMGPHFGMPMFYQTENLPAVPRMKIHYSRIIRFGGVKLPYNQRIMENLWDESILERLYDRMVAFDSTTQGAAQLAYKAWLRTMKIKQLREIIAAGGKAYQGLVASINFMTRFQGVEGLTLIDGEDEFEGIAGGADAAGNLAPLLDQFGQQLAGALQIPIVRLFGQSPGGLDSSGESDLRTYYDGIKQQQEQELREGVNTTYRLMALSEGIRTGSDFGFEFKSLWQMSDQQQAEVSERDTSSVLAVEERGLISPRLALQELAQRGRNANRWSNLTADIIAKADDEIKEPDIDTNALLGKEKPGGGAEKGKDKKNVISFKPRGRDMMWEPREQKRLRRTADVAFVSPMLMMHGMTVILEHYEGTRRFNKNVMPAGYGFILGTSSTEGVDEQMDCFIGPNPVAPDIWVIDQYDSRTNEFDEHKVMLGFDSFEAAATCYDIAYTGAPVHRTKSETKMTPEQLREWLSNGDMKQPVGPLAA
jgi:phage-related protein (TIGR01555 family)